MKANSVRLFHIEVPSDSPPAEAAPPVPTAAPDELAPRVRKTTFEVFTEEMSVLDRPLESEVEYYDEPKPRRWKVPAIGLAIFVFSCGGGYLALSHARATTPDASAATVAALPPAAVVAPAVAAEEPTAAASSVAPAPPRAAERIVLADAKPNDHHRHRSHHAGGRHHHHASRAARHGRG